MWSLLPIQLRKYIRRWFPLIILVLLWHMLLLWLIVGYRGLLYQHHIMINTLTIAPDVPMVVVPLLKTVPPATKRVVSSAKSATSTSKTVPSAAPAVQPSSPVQPKVRDAVSVAPAPATKKKSSKGKAKKAKEASKKPLPEAKPVEQKAVVPKPVTVPTPEEPAKAEKPELPTVATTTQELTDADAPVVIYIGREDMHAHELHEAVYEAVKQVWRPPPGFGAGVSVQVALDLNWQGAIEQYTLLQSSGVPLFDACVRRDSKKIIFPRSAWGKKWILTFSNDTKA